MTTRYALRVLSVLPVLFSAWQPIAAATGQPGLAVPGDGQPGLSTAPAPPTASPSLADYIPDPPAPPARPRPRQQTTPQTDTLIQQQLTIEPETEPPETTPEPVPVDPHTLRAGNAVVAVPDWIDAKTHDKAQAYLDYAEWQIAAGYDALGFPRDESDRRAASTITGGILSAVAGAEIVSVPAAGVACGVGAVVGGIVGGVVGAGAAGIGAPFGAGLGAGLGCLAGTAVGGVPGIIVGAMVGAVVGGAVGGALGGGVDVVKPDVPPLIDAPAVPDPPNPVLVEQDSAVAASPMPAVVQQAVEAVAPAVEPVVDSLHTALDALPPIDPTAFGPS